ncbi:MAG: HAMP domain-containing histidine kinase, partial [Spirochaetia bacterium]|nr:HAMP domain-containing histidine kinase [Spirochaetia bacterium]
PLSTILLNLQTMLKHPGLREEEKKEMLQEGIEGVKRLEEQVNNLLMGGEILRNKGKHRGHSFSVLEECDSVKVIQKYLTEHVIYFKNHHVSIQKNIPESMNLHISRDLLYKVLSNIISNAIQYSGERPEIFLDLRIDGARPEFCILTISDNGPGIPEDELQNIFKPLYRLEKKSAPIRGTGMGLYIVKEIILSCDGLIQAFSSNEEPGTKFEVRLPLARA